MKKLYKLLLVGAAFLCGSAVAQAQVGLEIGYVNSHQRFRPDNSEMVVTPQSGFYAELEYAVPIVAGLKIAPGIMYSYLAGVSKLPFPGVNDQPENNGKPQVQHSSPADNRLVTTNVDGPRPTRHPESVEHYLSIPVDVSYTFDFGRVFGLTAFVTPTLNCGLKSDLKYGNNSMDMYKMFEEMLGKENAYSKVDFVMGVGLSADFSGHFRIKCSYDFGLLDRAGVKEASLHHNQLKIGLGFMF